MHPNRHMARPPCVYCLAGTGRAGPCDVYSADPVNANLVSGPGDRPPVLQRSSLRGDHLKEFRFPKQTRRRSCRESDRSESAEKIKLILLMNASRRVTPADACGLHRAEGQTAMRASSVQRDAEVETREFLEFLRVF